MSDVDAAEVTTTEPDEWETPERVTPDGETPVIEEAVTPETEGDVKTVTRREPIALEEDVRQVCNHYINGDLEPPLGENKYLTPHAISVYIGEMRGGKDHRPSSGAVQACLKRWELIGFIKANDKPFSFDTYTEAGQTYGLAGVKETYAANAKAARAATKEAAAPKAAVEPTPEPVPEPEPF